MELCKPVLDSQHFLPLFMSAIAGQPRLFVLTSLTSSQSPTSCERRTTLHGQLPDPPTSIECEAPNLKKKKSAAICPELVGWRRSLESSHRHF